LTDGFFAQLDRRALFEAGDVYRIAYDEERATRPPVRIAVLGAGGVAQAKYLPSIARLRGRWEPVELVAMSTLDGRQADKLSAGWLVPVYVNSQELLREHAPDAVLITIRTTRITSWHSLPWKPAHMCSSRSRSRAA
jgi:GFO/IDH/MocA oxidoreductase family protein